MAAEARRIDFEMAALSIQTIHACFTVASRTKASVPFVTGECCIQEGKARAVIIIIVIMPLSLKLILLIFIFHIFVFLSSVHFVMASVKRVAENYYLPKGIDIYLPA